MHIQLGRLSAAEIPAFAAVVAESAIGIEQPAEIAHFLAVIREEAPYEPPMDQVLVHRVLEAIYRAADDGKEHRF